MASDSVFILSLPNEILQEILAHSVAARAWVDTERREGEDVYPWGTPRALRLRLVCSESSPAAAFMHRPSHHLTRQRRAL